MALSCVLHGDTIPNMEIYFQCNISEAGKSYVVSVWSRDAVNFYLSVFTIAAFSFSLFM